MIRKLQQKFVLITMVSLFLVLLVVVGTINGFYAYQAAGRADGALNLLAEYNGNFPDYAEKKAQIGNSLFGYQMTAESKYETRYFTVMTASDGTISNVCLDNLAALSSEQAAQYASDVLSSGKTSGYKDVYRYLINETPDGYQIIFIDCSVHLQTMHFIAIVSVGVVLFTLIVMFILVSFLSSRATKPVAESLERQKQFITNAGHELKTPIAIISANTDVIEIEHGENEWTRSIHGQTKRLDGLIKDFIMLSRMDETNVQLSYTDFSLSEMVSATAASFEDLAKKQGKRFALDIEPERHIKGDKNLIQQLVSILMDNALKYSIDAGEIGVLLRQQGKMICFEIKNICQSLPERNLNELFERFVRADESRSRDNGGYGIGLSVAKAIVETHKGKISVRREGDAGICFSFSLPVAIRK